MRRPTDIAARFGGEEFVALLTNTDLEGACLVAESICSRVATDSPEVLQGCKDGVSVSCGVAVEVPSDDVDSVDLIARADAKLYEAKSKGRNCVVS